MTVAQPRSEKPAVGHSEQIQTVHDDNSPEKCRMYVQTARRRPPTGFDEHGHTVHGRERFSNAPRQDPSRKVVDHRVQVHAGSVEQANNGSVDVPHLVGARRSKADRRLRRVHAEPGAAPAGLAHETVLEVEGEAQTLPSRCARTASVPVGTCRYSDAVTMSSIVRISDGVSRWGDLSGQDDWSSSAHACCSRCQAWNRLGDTRRNRRSARTGTNARARSTASRIRILARPSGKRSCVNVNPELRSRARASRRSAVSFFTRRRSFTTSCWSSAALRSVASKVTTTFGVWPSHPRAVERGTPRSVAMVTSPVRWTRSRSRWS